MAVADLTIDLPGYHLVERVYSSVRTVVDRVLPAAGVNAYFYSGLQPHEVSQRCAGSVNAAATQTKPKGCTVPHSLAICCSDLLQFY